MQRTLATPVATLRRSFLEGGLPTPTYRAFLLGIVQRFREFTPAERQQIRRTLMHWEEEALTGIMYVGPSDPEFASYQALVRAVFDGHPFQRGEGLDLANSTVVHLIAEVEKGCSYVRCMRRNPLHRELMHRRSFTNSGRGRGNNSNRNRIRNRNRNRSTHRSISRTRRRSMSRSPHRTAKKI